MKKPSKAKRKTGQRAKQTRAPPGGRPSRASHARPNRPVAAPLPQRIPPAPPRRLPLLAGAYSADERQSLLVLLAPFVLMTFAIGASQSWKPDGLRRQIAQLPGPPILAYAVPPPALPVSSLEAGEAVAPLPPVKVIAQLPVPPTIAYAALPSALPASSVELGEAATLIEPSPPVNVVVARTAIRARPGRCEVPSVRDPPHQRAAIPATDPARFGLQLAAAALAQTEKLIIYDDKYRAIRFPMGDVPALYGVCTDVVIRAYRALGIDLQVLVQEAGLGTGDPSIDHRRTKTLRLFFDKHGVSIPVTDFPEDYRPGDVVTYYRPQGQSSQLHIAIVSGVIAPSGRPMIIHNRGWGPQLEDALFAHQLTGHYRFTNAGPVDKAAPSQAMLGAPRRAQSLAPTPGRALISGSSAP